MPVFLIIVAIVVGGLVYVLLEKKSTNKHKKNQNYKTKNMRADSSTEES